MKKITQNLIWTSFFALTPVANFAQAEKNHPYHRCSTIEYEEKLKAKNPARMSTAEFEKFLAPKLEKFRKEKKEGRKVEQIYNIPVVIHIVHNGDPIGTGENITDAQATSQITSLNNDYRRLANTPGGANSTGLAVDCEINFVLAKQDPNGNPTTGIVRHNISPYNNNITDGTAGPDWETTNDVEQLKANTIWDTSRYLNMWTIRGGGLPLDQGGLTGLLGYAQFPNNSTLNGLNTDEGEANTDGVVAGFDVFGTKDLNDGSFILNSQYDLGRTMTHEVGHWLGLRHIWGDDECPTDNLTNNYTNEDFCADTPAAKNPNYECTPNTDSCTDIPGVDMIQNYMDYTPDACMDTFTNDQKTRMQTVMQVASRRGTLNNSRVATITKAGIYFKQEKNTYTYTQANDCSFTNVTYKISILKAPTANATVTFNPLAGTTAIQGIDYDFVNNNTITFTPSDSTDKTITIRYYNDGVKNANKILKIGMTLNNNGGDAVLIEGNNTTESPSLLTCNIIENIKTPSNTEDYITFTENFDTTTPNLIKTDLDKDTYNWAIFNQNDTSTQMGFTGKWLGSKSYGNNVALTPDNLVTFSTPLTIPTTNAKLSFNIAALDPADFKEYYAVYITTSNDANTIITKTPVLEETLDKGKTILTKEIDLKPYLGQKIYLSLRHFNCTNQYILMVDDIKISTTAPLSGKTIQTLVNTSTKYESKLNQGGIAYAKDATTNNLIANLNNLSNFNYDCTSVYVNRDKVTAGSDAVNYNYNNTPSKKVLAKSVVIKPLKNNPKGNEKVTFYFTEDEISAWETITGKTRNSLQIIKEGVNTIIPTTLNNFGTNLTLTGTLTNGFEGTYYFGSEETLTNKTEEFETFSLFPNPYQNTFTVQLTTANNNTVNIKLNDTSGREIYNKNFENDRIFNQTLHLNHLQNGIYFITVTNGTNKTVRKIIKN